MGDDAPEVVRCIIEIPAGSRAKYELDKESGLMIMDRVLYSAMHYPANYGFIPKTLCDDNDPLDILVLSQENIIPNCIVNARVIGVMHMEDGGENDDKLIAVAEGDMSVNHIKELSDLPQHTLDEIQNFFEYYKTLEKKEVSVSGFQDRQTALQVVKDSITMYNEKFGN
jgi:inorganic pyrophosphatase